MASYREIMRDYKYIKKERGIVGIRVFIRDDTDGTYDLPTVGDSFIRRPDNITVTACKCRQVEEFFPAGAKDDQPHYRCHYSNKPLDELALIDEFNPDPDHLPTNIDVGYQMLTIGKGDNLLWYDDSDAVNHPVFILIPVIKLTISRVVTKVNLTKLKTAAGKVNDGTWRECSGGVWMFHGAKTRDFLNHKDQERWEITYHFEAVFKTGESGDEKDGWNFFWNEDEGSFQKLKRPGGTDLMYSNTDFDTLFQGEN